MRLYWKAALQTCTLTSVMPSGYWSIEQVCPSKIGNKFVYVGQQLGQGSSRPTNQPGFFVPLYKRNWSQVKAGVYWVVQKALLDCRSCWRPMSSVIAEHTCNVVFTLRLLPRNLLSLGWCCVVWHILHLCRWVWDAGRNSCSCFSLRIDASNHLLSVVVDPHTEMRWKLLCTSAHIYRI